MNIELVETFPSKNEIVKDWQKLYEGILINIDQPIPSYDIKNLSIDIRSEFQKYIQSVSPEFEYEFVDEKFANSRVIFRTCEKYETFPELFDAFILDTKSPAAFRNISTTILKSLPERYTSIEDVISDYKVKYIFGNEIRYNRIYHDGSFCPCPSIIANSSFELIKKV